MEEENEEITEISSCQLVVSNPVLLDVVFGFLGYNDLKSCRLVSTLWENVSRPFYQKKSKIMVSSDSKSAESFVQDFEKSLLKIINFEFHHSICLASVLKGILQRNVKWISSLTLTYVNIIPADGDTDYSGDFDLRRLIGKSLKSLTIISAEHTTKMIISQRNLTSAKYLDLQACMLVLSPDAAEITAQEIHFKDIDVCRNYFHYVFKDQWQETIAIFPHSLPLPPNFINLSELSVLEIKSSAEELLLVKKCGEFLKPTASLRLINYHFKGPITTLLTKLSINNVAFNFDWELLPETLENLTLDDFFPFPEIPDLQPNFLPNLKELEFKYGLFPTEVFQQFASHTGLTKIKVSAQDKSTVSLNWIAPNVNEIHLENIKITGRPEDLERELISLTLVNYTFWEIIATVRKFKVKHLHLVNTRIKFTTFWKMLTRCSLIPVEKISIGQQYP